MLSEVYDASLKDGFGQRAEPGQFYFEVAAGRLMEGCVPRSSWGSGQRKTERKINGPKREATAGRITRRGESRRKVVAFEYGQYTRDKVRQRGPRGNIRLACKFRG